MTDTVATLSPASKNVVDNLRRTQGSALAPYADWQVDYAHRNWSSSEDFPNEDLIVEWIMPDTEAMRYDYMRLTARER